MIQLLWWIFAALAIVGAIGMIMGRNPVASLLFLVLTFFSLAAIYVLLGAYFISVVQIIVYAGAIMVLFLFVIMLLNLGHDYQPDLRRGGWMIVGGVATGIIGYVLSRNLVVPQLTAPNDNGAQIDAAVAQLGAVGAIAQPLFHDFIVPFELTSLLLLVAAIGAVLLAKRKV